MKQRLFNLMAVSFFLALPCYGATFDKTIGIQVAQNEVNAEIDDIVIQADILKKLLSDPILKQYPFRVRVLEGYVTLSGNVTTEQQYADALMLVRSVDGVKYVDVSGLAVQNEAVDEQVNLIARIKGNLINANIFGSANYISWPIRIGAEGGAVTVTGLAESVTQKTRILEIIKNTPRVTSVDEDIETSSLK